MAIHLFSYLLIDVVISDNPKNKYTPIEYAI